MNPLDLQIVLASSSPYRAALLKQIGLSFTQISPEYDEVYQYGENPEAMAVRFAVGKAESVARTKPNVLVIGSDQVAHLDGNVLGKPGCYEVARHQLASASGKWMTFVTSIVLMCKKDKITICDTEEFSIKFRKLTLEQIDSYLKADEPYDCAGSIKAEKLGISLIQDTKGRDINTLYGLPLILLTDLMMEKGVDLISYTDSSPLSGKSR